MWRKTKNFHGGHFLWLALLRLKTLHGNPFHSNVFINFFLLLVYSHFMTVLKRRICHLLQEREKISLEPRDWVFRRAVSSEFILEDTSFRYFYLCSPFQISDRSVSESLKRAVVCEAQYLMGLRYDNQEWYCYLVYRNKCECLMNRKLVRYKEDTWQAMLSLLGMHSGCI